MDQHAARLRAAGLKATAPRVAILAHLTSSPDHPTIEAVYTSLRRGNPTLSLSTVYKTIEALIAGGLVRRVPGEGPLRVDAVGPDHDHALCRTCGRLYDIARGELGIALPAGFSLHRVHVEYDVVCPDCQPT